MPDTEQSAHPEARVLVRGRFDELTDAQRADLIDDLPRTGIHTARFTAPGTLSYDRMLSWFTFRCQVPAGSDDDADLRAEAIARLSTHGYPHRDLRCSVTRLDDIPVRPKNRSRPR